MEIEDYWESFQVKDLSKSELSGPSANHFPPQALNFHICKRAMIRWVWGLVVVLYVKMTWKQVLYECQSYKFYIYVYNTCKWIMNIILIHSVITTISKGLCIFY